MLKRVLKQFWERKVSLLFAFLVGLHFIFIGSIPAGFNHDEIEKIASISTFIEHRADISGTSFPRFLVATHTQGGQNNFPVLLLSLFFTFVKVNQFTARIPLVFLNIGTALLLTYFVRRLTPKTRLSHFVFFVSLLNPWMWFLSRSITEAPFSLFFVLLSVYLIEKNSLKSLLLSAVSSVAALLSYWGTIIVVPIVFVSSLIVRRFASKSPNKVNLLVPLVLFSICVALFGISLALVKDSTIHVRSGELIFQNVNRYQPEVDKIRRESITNPLTPLLVNKYTLVLKDFSTKYLNAFSTDFLFVRGDPRATYQFGSQGMLYMLDFPLIILGLLYLSKRWNERGARRLLLYLLIFCVVSPLGSALNIVESSYVFRSVLLLPVFLVLSGGGLYQIFILSKKVGFTATALYLLFFVNFLNFYLYQYPVSHQENQFLGEEVVSSYLSRIPKQSPVTVVTGYPIQLSEKYLFYKSTVFTRDISDTIYSKDIQFDDIKFSTNCPTEWSGTLVVQEGVPCSVHTKASPLIIENFADSGSLWKIYNDTLCTGISLSSFRGFHQLNDYRLYNEDNSVFCTRQIHHYE